MLRSIDRAYARLLKLMLALAALYFGLMMVAIVYWTMFRTFGWDYNPYAFIFVEFGFIYCVMLGAPWLVRERGHVYIEIVTAAVSDDARNILSRVVAVIAFIICGVLAWYGGELAISDIVNDEIDVRGSRDIERWIVTISFPFGFGFMAIEFLRYVFGRETMHTGEAGVHE